jgi:isoleucyl-tRNA synthetase
MLFMANRKILEPYSVKKEEEIISFWKEKGIPQKAAEQGEKPFYMMDGPPYASGHIHMGTALNKIVKDVAIRSRRMQGFMVRAQPGYDTHGVPIELQIEKRLGIKNKKEIEKYGVDRFVDECRKFATQYIETMNTEFLDLGIWMDWENPYLTLSNEYIEGIWWTFKRADEQGMLYLGNYPVHVCSRCETAVAYNEIEYHKQADTAIYVKFPVEGEKGRFLIIWTTTPWTLPGNTGVMVHPDFEYAEVRLSNNEIWIIAKERVEELMGAIEAGFSVERTFRGKELEGLRYGNPLAKNLKLPKTENAHRVILSKRYVNLEEGSGLVHLAPGHGKEDYDAGTKAGLPSVSPVNIDGMFKQEAGKYAGGKAREIDSEIISDLEKDGYLAYRHSYTHDYPSCWRCKSPLLMLSLPQWFFGVEKLRERMLELNNEVSWVPDWGKARFKNWLESLGDWPISRQRYWGTPLPIWVCGKCGSKKVIGSVEELKKEAGITEVKDLHKPWVDGITISCSCGSAMKRVPEVMDVWFDSGCCSWASLGYPKDEGLFRKFWPADINIEGSDQIRGWWNSQMITSVICFNKKPYKKIVMHGMVLDVSKRKMSKSLGNIITPTEVIEKANRDALRFYLVSQSRGGDLLFDWDEFRNIGRLFNTLVNSCNYLSMYRGREGTGKEQTEDKWIRSRLGSLAKEVSESYSNCSFYRAAQAMERFTLEELSRTYIKLIRDRVDKGDYSCLDVLKEVILGLLRLFAPVTPHLAEYLYQEMREKDMPESVHLCMMEEAGKAIDSKLEEEMELVKAVTQQALSLREANRIRLRWLLNELVIVPKKENMFSRTTDIIARFCNLKKVVVAGKKPEGNYAEAVFDNYSLYLNLDTPESLKEEWEFTELRRRVQAMRKEAALMPQDKVSLLASCSEPGFLEKYGKRLEDETNTSLKAGKGKQEKVLEREFFLKLEK